MTTLLDFPVFPNSWVQEVNLVPLATFAYSFDICIEIFASSLTFVVHDNIVLTSL